MDSVSIAVAISNISCGVLIILISIPLLKGWISRNRFYGIRFAKSFESEENWVKINTYGAKRLMIWSVLMILIGGVALFTPLHDRKILTILIANAPLLAIIPAVESYLYARKL